MLNVLDLKNPAPAEPAPEPTPAVDLAAAFMNPGPEKVSWEADHALSGRARERHYFLMAGVAIAGIVLAWWQSSWLTFVALVAGLVAWELRERFARPVKIRIDRSGAWIGDTHFPHAELASFDIHTFPDQSVHLSLKTNRRLASQFHLPLGAQDADEVRAFLARHVSEEQHGVPLLEWWLRKQ